ncbi:hypothetical protein TKK_0009838 [Trichogramma kaykai]
MPNYHDINLAKETRNMSCNCYVCLTARFKGHTKVNKGKGHKRTFSAPKITKDNGLGGTMTNLRLGKGLPHNCKGASSTTARENVFDLVEKLPEKQQNQIISSLLKRKSTDSQDNIILNTLGSKV